MKTFTISPTIHDEVALFGLQPAEERRRGEGREERSASEQWEDEEGRGARWRILVKELQIRTIAPPPFSLSQEFLVQNLSNAKQMLRVSLHRD